MLAELQLEGLLGRALYERVKHAVKNNSVLLTEAREEIQAIRTTLKKVSQAFEQLVSGFQVLGLRSERLDAGEVELSVLFPRELFDNRLDLLLKEGGLVDRLVLAASQIATGKAEHAKIKELSTTDPTFVLVASGATILLVGRSVNVVLDAYKKVQNIRIARAAAEVAEAEADVIKALSKQATAKIVAEVEQFTKSLEKEPTTVLKEPALAEVLGKFQNALLGIAARIDRGLRIEVAAEPEQVEDATAETSERSGYAEEIRKLAGQMRYFQAEQHPILGLPNPSEEGASDITSPG